MKTKKILAVLMSMIVIMGVCGVGTGCDPNKETEAEYKARIKKELDEIPVEAMGYKLVDPTKQEVTYPEGEEPQKIWQSFNLNEHTYIFTYSSKGGIPAGTGGRKFCPENGRCFAGLSGVAVPHFFRRDRPCFFQCLTTFRLCGRIPVCKDVLTLGKIYGDHREEPFVSGRTRPKTRQGV